MYKRLEWHSSRGAHDGGMIIARDREYNGNIIKMHANVQTFSLFIRSYQHARTSSSAYDMYWNEVMSCNGRIVLDFDVDAGTEEYDKICMQYPLDDAWYPSGYEKYLERIILAAFRMLDMHEIADQLSKDSVLWWKDPMYEDRDCHLHMLGDGVYAPPFCWSSHCRSSKISLHVTLPVYVYDRHRLTGELMHAMSRIHGGSIGDMAMAKETQGIRLPWMGKMVPKGKNPIHGVMKLHDMRHYPWCITSWVDNPRRYMPDIFIIKDWVPSVYSIMTTNSGRNDDPINEIPDGIWEKIPEDIRNAYSGMYIIDGRHHLIPINPKEWPCPVCNCMHTKHTPFICRYPSGIYMTCMRKKDHNGHAICIEKHDDTKIVLPDMAKKLIQPMRDIPCTQGYLSGIDIYRSKRCKPFPPMDTWKTLMVCAEKGSGKTHQLGSFLKTVPMDVPICIIGFRIALGRELMLRLCLQDIGFTFYGDEGWQDSPRIITTVESLYKWKYPLNKCLCIMDEYESVLSQVIADTNQDRVRTIKCFGRMIRNASHVMVLDAGLTWNVGGAILRLYGRKMQDMVIQWNQMILDEYEPKVYYLYDKKGRWYYRLANEPPGTKINIRCSSHADQIASSIQKDRVLTNDQVVCITGSSDDKADNVEYTYDHGGVAEVCVINSVHQAGNSYDKEYFDVLYTFGNARTGTPMSLIQMEGRVRHHKRHDVHAHLSNMYQEWYLLDPKKYHDYMERVHRYDVDTLDSDEREWRYLLSPDDRLALSLIRTREAISKQYMREIYEWYQRDIHGHEVIYVDAGGMMTSSAPDTDIGWSPADTEIQPYLEIPMTSEMVDDMANDVVVKCVPPDSPPYIKRHGVRIIKSMYWYGRSIRSRGYSLQWKHAEKLFYDHWNKGTKVIQTCTIARSEYDAFIRKYKGLIDNGKDPGATTRDEAMPPVGIERNAMLYYDLLMRLKSMASIGYADGTHRWSFKASLRDDPVWKGLMSRCDRYFGTHAITKGGTCHRDMWKMLSDVLRKRYCIIHTMVDERVQNDGDRSVWWVIHFSNDDALVDVG